MKAGEERVKELAPLITRAAERHGTPLYLLDTAALIAQATAFREAFGPRTRLLYAFKSNDLPFLIRALKGVGVDADVASPFELQLALRLGFTRIIYTAPYKSDEALALAVKHRRKVILNVDDPAELERIIALCEGLPAGSVRLSLRLRAIGSRWNKFGLSKREAVAAAKRIAGAKALRLVGLHFHSSWNRSFEFYTRNLVSVRALVDRYPVLGAELEFIDIGGGYLVAGVRDPWSGRDGASLTAFAQGITERFSALFPGLELWLEPGRALCGGATMIVTRVRSLRPGRVRVDAGAQLLGETGENPSPVLNVSRPSSRRQKAVIDGPLCDPDDHWGGSYLGGACRVGDVLVILEKGAYSFSTAWRWQQPIAPYVAVQGKKILLVKREERYAERYAGCE